MIKVKLKDLGNLNRFLSTMEVLCSLRFAPAYRLKLKNLYRVFMTFQRDYYQILEDEKKALGYDEQLVARDNRGNVLNDSNKKEIIEQWDKFLKDNAAKDTEFNVEKISIDVGPDLVEEISKLFTPAQEAVVDDFATIKWADEPVKKAGDN